MQRVTMNGLLLLGLALLASGCGDMAASTIGTQIPGTASATFDTTQRATGPAVLGGTESAFIAQYGKPNADSINTGATPILNFGSYPGSNTAPLQVMFTPGRGDGDARADDVSAQAANHDWEMGKARSTCALFMPADSKGGKRVDVVDPTTLAVVGEDYIYTSATVASQFDAALFTDANNNTIAAGTFDVFYRYKTNSDASTIDYCSLIIGEEQTVE